MYRHPYSQSIEVEYLDGDVLLLNAFSEDGHPPMSIEDMTSHSVLLIQRGSGLQTGINMDQIRSYTVGAKAY